MSGTENLAHLSLRSEYSLLTGVVRPDELAEAAARRKVPAVAVTDLNNLHGVPAFARTLLNVGVKPIIGVNLTGGEGEAEDSLLLLAANDEGWRNLQAVVSARCLSGDGMVDVFSLLAGRTGGLVCLAGGYEGKIARSLRAGKTDAARRYLDEVKSFFQNIFLDIRYHGEEWQGALAHGLAELGKASGVPLVATNDTRYLAAGDAEVFEAVGAVGGRSSLQNFYPRENNAGRRFKTREEMSLAFGGEFEEALDNTLKVAEMCNVDVFAGADALRYPVFPRPDSRMTDREFADWVWRLASDNLEAKYPEVMRRSEAEQRLRHEFDIIRKLGFMDYFAIVSDFCAAARRLGVRLGPGRGSAVGSVFAYLAGITKVDPLREGLLFERFLNPERVSPPDIDIDIAASKRGVMIDYLRQKYGAGRVVRIGTFGTWGAKSAFKDAARVAGVPLPVAAKISTLIPDDAESDFFQSNPALLEAAAGNEAITLAARLAARFYGGVRSVGVHASGVVLTPDEAVQCLPLTLTRDGEASTQWDDKTVPNMGFLKLDCLGSRAMDANQQAADLLAADHIEFDEAQIDGDDAETGKVFASGNAMGVFQVEAREIHQLCRNLPVASRRDFAVATALCRPGPMELIPDFLDRSSGRVKAVAMHPLAEEITAESRHVVVYQEQVMRVAQSVAGFSAAEADLLRRAMGKKKPEEMAALRLRFISGAGLNRINGAEAGAMFDTLEKFAGYGFNKSHAAAYAMVSWSQAWLKAHHPAVWFASVLGIQTDIEGVAEYAADAARNKIAILPPDINLSQYSFVPERGGVRYGLGFVKGLPGKDVETVLAARREGGEFDTLPRTFRRLKSAGLGAKAGETLAASGALDKFGERNAVLLAWRGYARDKQSDAPSLFGEEAEVSTPDVEPMTDTERFSTETTLLGMSFARHPLTDFLCMRNFNKARAVKLLAPRKQDSGDDALQRALAAVMSAEAGVTGAGRPCVRLTLADETGAIKAMTVADKCLEQARSLKPGDCACFSGRVLDGGLFMISDITRPAAKKVVAALLWLNEAMTPDGLKKSLRPLCEPGGGEALPLFLRFQHQPGVVLECGSGGLPLDFYRLRQIMQLPGVQEVHGVADNMLTGTKN